MLRRFVQATLGSLIVLLLAAEGASADSTHIVVSGETLSHIAVHEGVTVRAIVAANGLTNPDQIRVGQKLTIPDKSSSGGSSNKDAVASGQTYRIQAGDSLGQIAISLGVRSRDLASLNNISNPNRIRAGQVLLVPSGAVPVSAGTPGTVLDTERSGHYGSLPGAVVNSPSRLEMIPYFEKWAKANGIPTDLLMSIAWHESGWRPTVVSNKGAVGIGQLMPKVSVWIAEDLIGRPNLDPNIAEDNIRMSARYIRWLFAYMDSEDLAIAAYYQGPGSVRRGSLYTSTEQYVASIKAHRRLFVADK